MEEVVTLGMKAGAKTTHPDTTQDQIIKTATAQGLEGMLEQNK